MGSIPITRSNKKRYPNAAEATLDQLTINTLNRRLLQHLAADSTDLASSAGELDAREFTCADTAAAERERLFRQTPLPIAFAAELPGPGAYLALDVLDVPLLLSRDEQGKLHALVNACAHRGMPVATGSGTARSLVCPFHGWAYNTDGGLRGRPAQDCFNAATGDVALRALPVAETSGVIVVGLTDCVAQEAVEGALEPLDTELAGFDLGNYRPLGSKNFELDANWKLVTDLSLESYHFRTLHRDSVATVLAAGAAVDTVGRHSRWAFPMKTIARLAELPESEWPQEVEGSITYTLYPGAMLLVNSLGAQMIRAEPGATPGSCRVSYRGVCRPDCDKAEARAAYEFGGSVFENEDLPAAAASQRGIAARGGKLPLGRNEPLLQFWHGQWREALQSRD